MENQLDFILKHYWDKSVPVDVFDIAKKLNLDVVFYPKIENDNQIIAKLFHLNNLGEFKKPTCVICNNLNAITKKFALTHQITHFILEHQFKTNEKTSSFNVKNVGYYDFIANQFAINYCIDKNKNLSIEELSKTFQVSTTLVHFRINQMFG